MTSLIIGHRGACGYRPEHTLASFELAISMGTDAIETDLVVTRDGVLVCRHDAELSPTTDVAERPRFANRRTQKVIDGARLEGWFVEDFTWDELRTLRARERWLFRNHAFDGRFRVLSLSELLQFHAEANQNRARKVDLLLELKHPSYFESLGIGVEEALLAAIERFGQTDASSAVVVESFEQSILRRLRKRTNLRLIQLIDDPAIRPGDFAADEMTFAQMIMPAGLQRIGSFAYAVGVWKRLIVPFAAANAGNAITDDASVGSESSTASGELAGPTSLVRDANAAGLQVHAWTFRDEPQFLAPAYTKNPLLEYQQFLELGVDGLITDFPDTGRRAVEGQSAGSNSSH